MVILEKSNGLSKNTGHHYVIKSLPKEKVGFINKYVKDKQKYMVIATLTGFIIIGTSFGIFQTRNNPSALYHVYLDGKKIGTIDNKLIIGNWESQLIRQAQQKYGSYNFETKNSITFEEEVTNLDVYDNLSTISKLNKMLEIQAKAVEIVIDGEIIGTVKDQATAERILDKLKEQFLPITDKSKVTVASTTNPQNTDTLQFKSIRFKEKLSIDEKRVNPEEIVDEEKMLTLLSKGTLEDKKYIVKKGDTISGLAVKFDLTTKQVFQLNPQLKSDLIHIGDEINVTLVKPYLTVQTTEVVTKEEVIPFKIVYKPDNSMFVNETKTIKEGKEGIKEVEYTIVKENGVVVNTEVLKENIIQEPIEKVMFKGTKIVPSRGSGVLLWPTNGGFITSYFGPRWGSVHNGIDIAGTNNYSIEAADNGAVIFADWKGGYGKTVMIDHNNGMVTLYAHLKSISVESGTKVAKGQTIGIMGNTGRSTGTHLHFEVHINSEPRNPLNYVGI